MRDTGRLSLALAAVALATIVGLAGLAQLKFSAFLSDSIGERLEIVAATVAHDLGTAIDLGLSIEAVANGERILERARGHDPAISGIAVFDLEGRVLHAVGDAAADAIDSQTHDALRLVLLEDAADTWSAEVDDRVLSGIVVDNAFGRPVAGVVVRYPVTEMRQQEGDMLGALLFDAAWVGLLVVLGIGIVFVVARRRSWSPTPTGDGT